MCLREIHTFTLLLRWFFLVGLVLFGFYFPVGSFLLPASHLY